MRNTSKVSRRGFLKGTAAAGAALAAPTIIPASALGAEERPAPSNRIVMGAIGVGSMGGGDMRGFLGNRDVQMVAVCDVDRNHREKAKKSVDDKYGNKDCTAHLDFRELIGRRDLDAVMLATPDHWHAIPAIAAARAGLDIHSQKPFARSIREGRAICNAVKRYGRVWQTGSQQRSDNRFRRACELVRNGRIGKVLHTEVGLPTGGGTGVRKVQPVPDGLDWEFWLGPAPKVPFRGVAHWDWRWIMDYSGGQLTDWAGHHIDIAHWGLGLERSGPIEIEGEGVYPNDGIYNVPSEYEFTCKYADGNIIKVANNKRLKQGAKWYGEKGWVHVNRGGLSAEPESILKEEIGPDEIILYKSRGHKGNFLECIKSRKETVAPAEIGHRSISVGLLGEIAMLTGRRIRFDPEKEEILGDPGAAALLGRSYREPWVL